jgi:hypothetical protein
MTSCDTFHRDWRSHLGDKNLHHSTEHHAGNPVRKGRAGVMGKCDSCVGNTAPCKVSFCITFLANCNYLQVPSSYF